MTKEELLARAEVLLAALINTIDVDPVVAEIRMGDIAWDACDCNPDGPQVVVRLVNVYPSSQFPGFDSIRPRSDCAAGWAGTYEMAIIRCADPDADPVIAMGDHADLAVAACSACAEFAGDTFLSGCSISTSTSIGPVGNCIGALLQVIVELPGCCS